MSDRQEIRDAVDDWAVWRDSGDWDRFATVWSADGWMTATWFQGPAADFIAISRKGFEAGVRILHFLGGTTVELAGDRAVAQTKMTISQRAFVHDVEVDVYARDVSMTSFGASPMAGSLCVGSRSTRRIGWTRSLQMQSSHSTRR